MKREQLYLNGAVEAADKIAVFLQGHDFDSFERSKLLESAVAHQLTIIGNAATLLSAELKARYATVQWERMAGLWDQLVRRYFEISWEHVWETATTELPAVRNQIAEILRQEFPETSGCCGSI
jgi:uncharacterized protein with HEPN domain